MILDGLVIFRSWGGFRARHVGGDAAAAGIERGSLGGF